MHIFVGNLAFTATAHDLRQLFEQYGAVETVQVMTDHETGRSCGYCFVDMPERSTAKAAIADLHTSALADCALTVNEATAWAWRREPTPSRW